MRTLWGGRISLLVALVATAVSLVIGVTYGAVAGYVGGRVDQLMMRIVDILYALPFMFLVILLMVLFGRNIVLIFVAIGAINWLDMARIVRGQTLSLKNREFVEAARAGGVPPGAHHPPAHRAEPARRRGRLRDADHPARDPGRVVPELPRPRRAGADDVLGRAGERRRPGAGERRWWMIVFPSLFLAVTLFCFNFLGDGLRDALDPRDRSDR